MRLERSAHPLFTRKLTLSSHTAQAYKQIREWDVWIEENKAYVQNKLPGFESPTYLIVIGRGHKLSDTEKAHLRSIDRDSKNTQLLTYDDVLTQYQSTIARLSQSS